MTVIHYTRYSASSNWRNPCYWSIVSALLISTARMNRTPNEEVTIFHMLFFFLQKKTAYVERNNGRWLPCFAAKTNHKNLCPKTKKKTNKEKTKYLTPERACELEVKTSLWQQGLLVTRGRSKYIQRCSKYIWQFKLTTRICFPPTEVRTCCSCKPCHCLKQLLLFSIHTDNFHINSHLLWRSCLIIPARLLEL